MSGSSLWQQAETGELPDHQFIDKHTIQMISQALCDLPQEWGRESCFVHLGVPDEILRRFDDIRSAYSDARIAAGIHGSRHATRVAVFSFWLAKGAEVPLQQALVFAALYHDSRRQNDRRDLGHGSRAAEAFRLGLCGFSTNDLNVEQKEIVDQAMRFHDVDWHEIPDNYRHRIDIRLFKAADALDRYRLPKRKWWPDPAMLKHQPAISLLPSAAVLMCLHEAYAISGVEEIAALTQASNQSRALNGSSLIETMQVVTEKVKALLD